MLSAPSLIHRTIARLLATLLAVALTACSSSSFKSQDTKASSESKRPSDEGEGVAGYLTDPEGLTYETSEGDIRVSGGKGAVTASSGSVTDLLVCLAKVRKNAFIQAANAKGELDQEAVTLLAETRPSADGSFTVETESKLDADDLIAVAVATTCESTGAKVAKDSRNLVFRDQSHADPFDTLDLELETDGPTKSTDSGKSPLRFLCLEETADCTEGFVLTVVDGDSGKTMPAKVSAFRACKTEAESVNIEKECDFLDSVEISDETKVFHNKTEMFLTVSADGYRPWQMFLNGETTVTAKLTLLK
jgi:hypothetical protein